MKQLTTEDRATKGTNRNSYQPIWCQSMFTKQLSTVARKGPFIQIENELHYLWMQNDERLTCLPAFCLVLILLVLQEQIGTQVE